MMRNITILFFLLFGLFITNSMQAQGRKIDTTANYGDVGYHVTCSNKKESENLVTITPKGFKNTVRDVSFPINGRLSEIFVDDLNDDGFPDLLLCFYSGAKHEIGNIYGISSTGNTALVPVSFPDIYSEPKLREGYRGHDEFSIAVGSLLRSFPIYKTEDTDKPTGGTRVIQYKIMPVPDQNGALTLKLLRSYIR